MKTIAILLAMILGSDMCGQSNQTGRVTTTVPNIKGENGEVLFAVYREGNFMNKQPDFSMKTGIFEGKAEVTFENLPTGKYSVLVLHDENRNGRMDFDPNPDSNMNNYNFCMKMPFPGDFSV